MALCLFTVAAVLLAGGALAFAEGPDVTAESSSTTTALVPDSPSAAKPTKPAEPPKLGIKFGFDERMRQEDLNNNSDHIGSKEDDLRYYRFKTRVFANFNVGRNLDIYVRLANEATKKTKDPSRPNDIASPFAMNEIFFDNFYMDFKKLPVVDGLSLKVGRQDMYRGDGFLFFTGGTGVASRSIYFNAFDLAYTKKKYKLEFIGIFNPKYDEFLPVINAAEGTAATHYHRGKQLTEWDETAAGLYFTDRNHKNTDWDAYYFFKREYNDMRAHTNYLFQPDRHFNTIGGRLVQRVPQSPGLKLVTEWAYEFGTQNSMASGVANTDIRAWGGIGYAKKTFQVKTQPWLLVGFRAYSGQKAGDKTSTNWDPLFSRWPGCPQFPGDDIPCVNEGYPFTQVYEVGVAYNTNQKVLDVQAGFQPTKKIKVTGYYGYLGAMNPFTMNPYHVYVNPIATPTSVSTYFSNGTRRGQMVSARSEFAISSTESAYLYLEKAYFGNFYVNKNSSYYFRVEWMHKFNKFIPYSKN